MLKYLKIENKGSFDINLATVVGFTTKRDDDSKVGKFGSGLKYSYPYLLRNNVDFKFFNGTKEVAFTSEKIEGYHNGNIVTTDVVVINGTKTNISLDAGPDWKDWFVVREIVQNAVDEEEFSYSYAQDFEPREGYVQWYLPISYFKEVIFNWDDYFSFERKVVHEHFDYEDATLIKYFHKPDKEAKPRIFFKGFFVGFLYHSSPFDVSVDVCDINEYRLISNEYSVAMDLSKAALKNGTPELFIDLNTVENTFLFYAEHYLTSEFAFTQFAKSGVVEIISPAAKLSDLMNDPFGSASDGKYVVPFDMYKRLHQFGAIKNSKVFSDSIVQPAFPSGSQTERLNKIIDWFEKQNIFFVSVEVSAIATSSSKNIVLGTVDMNTGQIFLNICLFQDPQYTDHLIAQTLYEEWAHYTYKAGDNTRKFQDSLIGDIICLREKLYSKL